MKLVKASKAELAYLGNDFLGKKSMHRICREISAPFHRKQIGLL